MPIRRRKKVSRRKRSSRRGIFNKNIYHPQRPILSGFPKSQVVKLRYVDTGLTLDPGVGLISEYVYRANSVFDPDFTGVGHQPMGFDEWANIYNRYTVLGSRITVYNTPATTTNVTPGYFGVVLSANSTPIASYTSIDNLLESKLAGKNWRTAGSTLTQTTRGNSQVVSKNFSAKNFFGVTDVNDGTGLSSVIGGNPTEHAHFGIYAASIDGNNPGSLFLTVMIDYIVQFREPDNLDGS